MVMLSVLGGHVDHARVTAALDTPTAAGVPNGLTAEYMPWTNSTLVTKLVTC